jgi:orotate phosphoribosyltransferase
MPNETQTTEAGLTTAKALLDIKAVNFRPEEPYILTAGWASPVYIDCRWVISFTEERRKIIKLGVDMLRRDGVLQETDMMAGGETAGIPYAAWLSEATSKPMLYVRKKAKGFGRNAQIEGNMEEGKHVLLVEDLATDGGSKLNFVNALRDAGATVSDSFVVFYYGVFTGALDSLEEAGITLRYLATWHDVIKVAEDQQSFSLQAIQSVKEFLADPISWSAAHGGKGLD